jgi:hypothetical protein
MEPLSLEEHSRGSQWQREEHKRIECNTQVGELEKWWKKKVKCVNLRRRR